MSPKHVSKRVASKNCILENQPSFKSNRSHPLKSINIASTSSRIFRVAGEGCSALAGGGVYGLPLSAHVFNTCSPLSKLEAKHSRAGRGRGGTIRVRLESMTCTSSLSGSRTLSECRKAGADMVVGA
jgi:hypothetical protein